MSEEVNMVIDETRSSMQESVTRLETELLKVRAGRANPSMLDGLMVDYYGTLTPLNQVANVGTADARTLRIQPWEKKMLEPIAQAIIAANLGFNPQNNGEIIMINIPPLTEERRKELVKRAKGIGEDMKVAIRTHRREANDMIKSLKNDGLPEDALKAGEESVQKLTDSFIAKVDELVSVKEKDIMTV
ncbi:MAG: ribosome recycling factor [Flavobacteriales bacterium]